MILDPAVISLLLTSVLISLLLLYSGAYGLLVVKRWDLASGSEYQLALERRTYLISTIMTYVCCFQLLSLFLYLFTADSLHRFFVGAMCAAGTLSVNPFGYPTLVLKILNFLAAGTWLIINHVDNRAPDYPLIRGKYLFILILTPFVVGETVLLANYLLRLNPDIITSCCGALFSAGSTTVQSGLAALPVIPMMALFCLSMVSTIASGLYFLRKGKAIYLFSALALLSLPIAIASVVSFISLYFYDLPTHHCPFCILQREYSYVGYFLYITLFGGGLCGIGVGALTPVARVETLRNVIPSVRRRLTWMTIVFYLVFTGIVTYRIITSPLILVTQ